jgi:hypothetical protein
MLLRSSQSLPRTGLSRPLREVTRAMVVDIYKQQIPAGVRRVLAVMIAEDKGLSVNVRNLEPDTKDESSPVK